MWKKIIENRNLRLSIWLLGLFVVLCPVASADEWDQQFQQKLTQWLQPQRISAVLGYSEQRTDLHTALIRFYRYRQFQPAWIDSRGLLPEGKTALETIRNAGDQGLNVADYYNCMLDELVNGTLIRPVADGAIRIGNQLKLDMMLTDMLIRYAMHVSSGHTAPYLPRFGDTAGGQLHRDLAAELATARDSGDLAAFLNQLGPRHPAYLALQKSLRAYRKVQAEGGWPLIDEGPTLRFGDRGARVAMLRYRLLSDRAADTAPGVTDDQFDDALAVAVMRFQRRHGLEVDGMVGPGTLAAINVPVAQRIRQIELNLERWRWMPNRMEPYHIMVNIPAFELKVVDGGQTVKAMRVIVGREERPTPMLASRMTYLELNPYWNVPSKIAREDLLPKIQKDPKFLVRRKFQVFNSWAENAPALDPLAINWAALNEDAFPYRLRQAPTPGNALGRVKFMFPNEYSVYIHDTPSKRLFVRASRTFSSGCVRVEKPMELATLLLSRQSWGRERLAELLASDERKVVVLKKPVPVYLVYMTAWADENGEVNFRDDIYGRDLQLQAFLDDGPDPDRKCKPADRPTYVLRTDQGSRPSAGI